MATSPRPVAGIARWKSDLLAIVATQGFGLPVGIFLYGFYHADSTVYYWTIPAGILGVAALVAWFRVRRQSRH